MDSEKQRQFPLKSEKVTFDHEGLDVYQLELRFIAWVTPLLEEAVQQTSGKPREVCDQLDRASLSSLLNENEDEDDKKTLVTHGTNQN